MRYFLPALVAILALLLLTACSVSDDGSSDEASPAEPSSVSNDGGNSDDNGSNDDEAPLAEAGSVMDITDIILTSRDTSCDSYAGQYSSSAMDQGQGISFSGNLTITVVGNECQFQSNAIPNHDFNDGSGFANITSPQSKSYTITVAPMPATATSDIMLGQDNAIFLNGVKLDLLAAACYGIGNEPLGRERIGCGGDATNAGNPWRYDPLSPLNNFGTDSHNAHTQPSGEYHYHGNPMALFHTDCSIAGTPSPVIGFAADGFPIFGPCVEIDGVVRQAQSSYRLRSGARQTVAEYQTPAMGQGSIASSSYDGQFIGDYEYQAGLGDLDECNGMMLDGSYGYYVTDNYPWVIRCFKGTPDPSFGGRTN